MLCGTNLFKVVCVMLAVVGTALFAMPAMADFVVANGDFESPAFTAGTEYVYGTVTDWEWSPSASTDAQLNHPSASGAYAAPVDGITILGLENQSKNSEFLFAGGIQQDLGIMVEGETYTFSATLYSNSNGDDCIYDISFYNVTDALELAAISEAVFDPSAIGPSETLAASFNYTATASDAGDTLRLIMEAPNDRFGSEVYAAGNWYGVGRTGVDGVSVSTIPEPGSLSLLGCSLLGLLAYAWRKRT